MLGRMSRPVPVKILDLQKVRLCPRFAVQQGLNADGSLKIRAIDNLSWWSSPEATVGEHVSKKRMKVSIAVTCVWSVIILGYNM